VNHTLTDSRLHIDPCMLEMTLIMKLIRDRWDAKTTLYGSEQRTASTRSVDNLITVMPKVLLFVSLMIVIES